MVSPAKVGPLGAGALAVVASLVEPELVLVAPELAPVELVLVVPLVELVELVEPVEPVEPVELGPEPVDPALEVEPPAPQPFPVSTSVIGKLYVSSTVIG